MAQTSITPPASIGFIGLGNMGYPMGGLLARAGYQLHVYDLNRDSVEKFSRQTGASAPDSLKALGEACQVVITMLPEGKAVRGVLLGKDDPEDSAAAGLKDGGICIDMSSCSPLDTRSVGKDLEKHGLKMVDAPVSGGVAKAREGKLAIMAGGEAEVVEAVRPLLEVMGKVFHTGGTGTGHAMKAMNNYLSAATLTLTAEAVITGSRFGLDPKVMVDIINASTGRSNSSEQKFPAYVLPRSFDSGFYLGLMAKDLRFAVELAESQNTPRDLMKGVSRAYNAAEQELGFQADNTEIVRYLESLLEDRET